MHAKLNTFSPERVNVHKCVTETEVFEKGTSGRHAIDNE